MDELSVDEQDRSLLYDEYKKQVERQKQAKKAKNKKTSKRKASNLLDRFRAAKRARFMSGKSLYDRPKSILSVHQETYLM